MIAKKLLSPSLSPFQPIQPLVLTSLLNSTAQSSEPFLPKNPCFLATDLIKSYFERGLTQEARTLFEEMSERDVVAWTAMVAGYTSCNHQCLAWGVFCDMLRNEITPNAFTFSSVLKACKGMKALKCGASVHGLVIKHGLGVNVYVDNALTDFYATTGATMEDACNVFQNIHAKNAVSWTTLITGFTHRGDGYSGLQVFQQMLLVSG